MSKERTFSEAEVDFLAAFTGGLGVILGELHAIDHPTHRHVLLSGASLFVGMLLLSWLVRVIRRRLA